MLPQEPPESPLALCPKEQKCNRGAPSWARSPLRNHPGNPESFPSVCAWGFPGLSLPQASPCRCGSQVCGLGVPRLGRMGRIKAAPAAQEDPHSLRGVSFVQGRYLSRHVSADSRNSVDSRQGGLMVRVISELPSRCGRGGGHPVHLPEGGVGSPPHCS